ncbi:helix-turn-helix domain-containing protein, partial [Bacillus sp. JJ1503]
KDDTNPRWLGIPFESISKQELALLKTLLHYETTSLKIHPKAQKWYDFLYLQGELPPEYQDSTYRLILYHLNGIEWERNDLEEAIYGFFPDDSIILWEDHESGVIIERNPEQKINGDLFLSLSQTIQSDFFIKAYFYCGKVQSLSKDWPDHLKEDKYFFENVIQLMPAQPFHTFEKCFPFMLSNHLPKHMQEWLRSQLLLKIADEPELLTTVKRFLENNSNATLTAKQLYIHRNTLQYRLDKFAEKTGVNLKDFHSTITVFLACLLLETDWP